MFVGCCKLIMICGIFVNKEFIYIAMDRCGGTYYTSKYITVPRLHYNFKTVCGWKAGKDFL